MSALDVFVQNKEFFKVVYALIISLICTFIVLKTHKFFHLSLHQGIRYLRNAFFFYGLAFFTRYILGAPYFANSMGILYGNVMDSLFQFFLATGGFFLLYSLIWKKVDTKKHFTSLWHTNLLFFYTLAIIITVIDKVWLTYSALFFSQIVVFLIASIISLFNYFENKKAKFLKFYLVAMIFSLAAWILNALVAIFLNWNQLILISTYLLNIIVFLIFLYGVFKSTK
jgi:hypothetical protein